MMVWWRVDKVDQVDEVDMDKVDYEIKGSVYLHVHKVHWVHNVHIK
jgi:hypothetical protein